MGFLGSLIWVSSGPSSPNGDMIMLLAATAMRVLALLARRGTYILRVWAYLQRYRAVLNALSSEPPGESSMTFIVSWGVGFGNPKRSWQHSCTRRSVDAPGSPTPMSRPINIRHGLPPVSSTNRLPEA